MVSKKLPKIFPEKKMKICVKRNFWAKKKENRGENYLVSGISNKVSSFSVFLRSMAKTLRWFKFKCPKEVNRFTLKLNHPLE